MSPQDHNDEEADALLGAGAAHVEPVHFVSVGEMDPDDLYYLHDGAEDDTESEDVKATLLSDEKEAELVAAEGHQGKSSPSSMLWQGSLCMSLVGISVYETIFKTKAVRGPPGTGFDFNSLIVMQAIVSVVIGVSMSIYYGKFSELKEDIGWKLLQYTPVGATFALAAYIQMIALGYLAPDVFKVLEQSRLLVTALLGFLVLRKKLSSSSWVALFAITLCCLTYGHMKTMDKQLGNQQGIVLKSQQKASELGSLVRSQGDVLRDDVAISAKLGEVIQTLSPTDISASKDVVTGLALTGVFILLTAGAGLYSEVVLKKGHHTPFYIQKVYQEIPGGLFAVLCSWLIRPILVQNGLGGKKLDHSFLEEGLFHNWDRSAVMVTFAFFIAKSWMSGIIVKQLSAVAKQVCSICSVCTLYFVILVHNCTMPEKGSTVELPLLEFCPSGLGNASFPIIVCDLAVLCTVMSYVTALRDKKRKGMFKSMLKEAEKKFANTAQEQL